MKILIIGEIKRKATKEELIEVLKKGDKANEVKLLTEEVRFENFKLSF